MVYHFSEINRDHVREHMTKTKRDSNNSTGNSAVDGAQGESSK
jgi:hypothetical protein